MDALSHLFTAFPFRTDLFFLGRLCSINSLRDEGKGYLHIIRKGRCLLADAQGRQLKIEQPTLVLSPGHTLHSITPLDAGGADIFCISFDFGQGVRNPVTHTLRGMVPLQLADEPDLAALADRLFSESTERACGHQVAIQYLCAYLTIQVLRCIQQQMPGSIGLLRGMADRHIGEALRHMMKDPATPWQVDELADKAGMSRSRFSARFRELMGLSPMDYLTDWRIAVAQNLLLQGMPVARVAERTGYSHNAALTRAFQRLTGQTPTAWLASHQATENDTGTDAPPTSNPVQTRLSPIKPQAKE